MNGKLYKTSDGSVLRAIFIRVSIALACVLILMAGQCPAGNGGEEGGSVSGEATSDGIVWDGTLSGEDFSMDYLMAGSSRVYMYWIGLIRFDPGDIGEIPDGTTIKSANLTLTQFIYDQPPTDDTLLIDRIKTSWDEGTIDHATADDDLNFVVTNPTTYNVSTGENTFDITDIVQAWVSGAANNGIRLKKVSFNPYNYEYFRSIEYATASERPQLTVEW
jgi:hypothetical protein